MQYLLYLIILLPILPSSHNHRSVLLQQSCVPHHPFFSSVANLRYHHAPQLPERMGREPSRICPWLTGMLGYAQTPPHTRSTLDHLVSATRQMRPDHASLPKGIPRCLEGPRVGTYTRMSRGSTSQSQRHSASTASLPRQNGPWEGVPCFQHSAAPPTRRSLCMAQIRRIRIGAGRVVPVDATLQLAMESPPN